MSRPIYDLLILGGGPAGVTAALRARELGATVALIERGRMGGTCTNDGCVPTRVLAKAARLARDSRQFAEYGLSGEQPAVQIDRVMDRVRSIVETIHAKKQMLSHLAECGVTVRENAGFARFADPQTVVLPDGERWSGRRILLCVGGHARRLPLPGGELALTHSDIWSLTQLPGRLLVVGAAATGCQIASVMAAFGSRVTLADAADRITPAEDQAVSDALAQSFAERGITLMLGCGQLQAIKLLPNGAKAVVFARGDEQTPGEYDMVIQAVGWPGNIDELGLDAAGVSVERGYVVVNAQLQTTAPNIYAAGDITGRMMLVQSAGDEARVAAENAVLGTQSQNTHGIVPHGGFTDPEYAGVGLTDTEARRLEECVVASVPYSQLDRAVIDGRREGFCKLIVSCRSRRILGAHVVGEQALEIVQAVAATMAAGATVETLARLEIAYPTFTGIIGLAARRILRDLGIEEQSPQWRHLQGLGAGEWERT